jgi:tetratricopeptide (TPR) repeat protein
MSPSEECEVVLPKNDQSRPKICLSMIVKDEEHVIRRCLDSIIPFIDSWVVVDTGSVDDTPKLVKDALGHLPGELLHEPWIDFSTNRNQSLEVARKYGDYVLFIDADDVLITNGASTFQNLTQDGYFVNILDAGIEYKRVQLVSNKPTWRFRGVLHEFIDLGKDASLGHIPASIIRGSESARRKNAEVFAKDAQIIADALQTESDPLLRARYTFYLAQSMKDAGNFEAAITSYRKRAKMGGWQEEVYYSLLQVARLLEQSSAPFDEVSTAYREAIISSNTRLEAIHGLIRFLRLQGEHERARTISELGYGRNAGSDDLFLEPWVYEYGFLDECGMAEALCENYTESIHFWKAALESKTIPDADRERINNNIMHARAKATEKVFSTKMEQ